MFAPPLYKADAQIVFDPKSSIVTRDPAGEPNNVDAAQLETHIVILRSRMIGQAVIRKLKLQDEVAQSAPASGGIASFLRSLMPGSQATSALPRAGNAEDKTANETAVAQLQSNLRIVRVGGSYVIEVSYTSRDPEQAARVANATIEVYLQSLNEARAEAARTASEWLEDRILHLRVQMNAAARRAQQLRASQDYRITDKGRDASVAPAARSDQSQLSKEPATLEELELTADTYRKAYQQFYGAFAETVQRESYPISNVRVITKAVVPSQRSEPRTLQTLVLGAVSGAGLGLGLAMLRRMLRRRVSLG